MKCSFRFAFLIILLFKDAVSVNPFGTISSSALNLTNREGERGWSTSIASSFVLPSIACADLNNDQIDDIILKLFIQYQTQSSTYFHYFYFLLGSNESIPIFASADAYEEEASSVPIYPLLFVVGDINNDGIIEFGTSSANYLSYTIRNFTTKFVLSYQSTHEMLAIAELGDVNGDKIDDFAITFQYQNKVCIIWGKSGINASVFGLENLDSYDGISITGTTTFGYIIVNNVGDYNKDGINDIVIADFFSAYLIYGRNGTSGWVSEITEMKETDGFKVFDSVFKIYSLAVGDVSGDKIQDFVYIGEDSNAYLLFGNKNTSLIEPSSFTIEKPSSGKTPSIAIGDINNDGIGDISFRFSYTSDIYTVFGRDTSELAWPSSLNLASDLGNGNNVGFLTRNCYENNYYNASEIHFGDVNGDKVQDLVASFSINSGLVIYSRFGTTWFLYCEIMNTKNTGCSQCESGYGINPLNGHCQDCSLLPNHYYVSNTLPCKSCLEGNCLSCYSNGICKTCESEYELSGNGTCVKCTNKQTYNSLAQKCVDCVLENGCESCNSSTEDCTSCPSGKFIHGKGCKNCTLNNGCLSCNMMNGNCLICPNGMIVNGTGCINEQYSELVNITIILGEEITESDIIQLENEIAAILGINVNEINVVLISSTEVQVTISETLSNKLIDIINNGLCN